MSCVVRLLSKHALSNMHILLLCERRMRWAGITSRRTPDEMRVEEAGDAVLNSLKLARWY